MRIYNLFPLLAGKFQDWKPHLARAAEMGFDWVFVNPIQYPGRSGSLYSIKDYYRFNPLFVDETSNLQPVDQFKRAARDAAELGLKLMVDLVANHCAVDSPLVAEHPEWFLRESGRIVHPSCREHGKKVVWKDLVQFDHKHTRDREGLFQFVRGVVEYLIDLGFEG